MGTGVAHPCGAMLKLGNTRVTFVCSGCYQNAQALRIICDQNILLGSTELATNTKTTEVYYGRLQVLGMHCLRDYLS